MKLKTLILSLLLAVNCALSYAAGCNPEPKPLDTKEGSEGCEY